MQSKKLSSDQCFRSFWVLNRLCPEGHPQNKESQFPEVSFHSRVTLLVGYTFPGRNPVLWYRGKVNADSQGRCHSIKSFQHSRHFHHPEILPLLKYNLRLGMSSRQRFHVDTRGGLSYTITTRWAGREQWSQRTFRFVCDIFSWKGDCKGKRVHHPSIFQGRGKYGQVFKIMAKFLHFHN